MIRGGTALLALELGLAGRGAWAQDGYYHEDHRHRDYRFIKRIGLHGHVEGGAFKVRSVYPDTAAEAAGLQAGDWIVRIDGDPVRSIHQFCREIIEAYEDDDDTVEVHFAREGRIFRAFIRI